MTDMHALVDKILNDASFRDELAASPRNALENNGFEASDDLVATFDGMDSSALAELASNFSADKAAC